MLGELGPVVSGDPVPFCSSILRIRTRDPVLGPLPVCAKALDRPTDGLITEQSCRQTLFVADLGSQRECPPPCGLAKGTRGLMQQVPQPLARSRVQRGLGTFGAVRLLRQAGDAIHVEGTEDVANGLHGAADELGDGCGCVPAGAGPHNLGPTYAEGMGGAPRCF